ncbi:MULTISPECIES: hypothetical protein [unclassified Streptomyces]|uniref:hypothetical protein n=1 Tax=unclassified Streptomyces TaxID=2593676 RepID=UPI003251E4CE
MLHHKTALRLAAPVAVLALALTACGGGDDKADSKSPATAQAKASPTQSAASGGEMGTGEAATGKFEEDPGVVTYGIVAQKVVLGTEADARKVVADAKDAEGKVLATAQVKFTHKSGPALTDSADVNDGTEVYADGVPGAILVGADESSVAGCEDAYDVESWKQGESHVFCETYLVPADAKSVEVHWAEEDGEPYIWKFPNS